MADYEGGKTDGVARTFGGIALGGAGLALAGSWLNNALQSAAGYIGAAIRGGGAVPFGGFHHGGFAAPVAPMPPVALAGGGFGGEIALAIENASLRQNTEIQLLKKELEFERKERTREDVSVVEFIRSHYVPGKLIMPASEVVTTTPVGGSGSSSSSTTSSTPQ